MPSYATWVTFVFLQVSVLRWFVKHKLGCWAFRGWENSGSIVEVLLLEEYSTGCQKVHQIVHFLCHCQTDHQEARPLYPTAYPLIDLGNPSPWITCQVFLPLSMETTVFLWSSTGSWRWPLWQPARRISQQEPLLNSSLHECGWTLRSHNLSSQIGIVGSSVHFGLVSGRCWTPNSLSPQPSCWECNKMMELSGKKLPSLRGPAGYFWRSLFLDIWIMVYEL